MFGLKIVLLTACAATFSLNEYKNTNRNLNKEADFLKSNEAENILPQLTLRLANAYPESDIRDLSAQKFAELVKEKSDGKMNIEIFPSQLLGDWQNNIEGLKMGVYQIVIGAIDGYERWSDKANIDSIPYLFDDYEHFIRVWESPFGQQMKEEIGQEADLVFLGNMYRGAREVFSVKPIYTVEDLQDLEMRVPPIEAYISVWDNLGTDVRPITLYNTYSALEAGIVDAQENPISDSYNLGFGNVTDYLIKTDHVRNLDVFALNKDYFESLPKEYQDILIESANEASDWRNEIALENEAEDERKLINQGMTIIEVDKNQFKDELENFTEEEYPFLIEWVEKIKSM